MSSVGKSNAELINELKQKRINNETITIVELNEMISTRSIIDPVANPNALTVFYSTESDDLINAISDQNNPNVRIVRRTEAAKLLSNDEFRFAVEYAISLEDTNLGDEQIRSLADKYFYDTTTIDSVTGERVLGKGKWSELSREFAADTKGDAYALISKGSLDRIYSMDELYTWMETAPNDKSMSGISKSDLSTLTHEEQFLKLKEKSTWDFKDTTNYYDIENNNIGRTFKGTPLEGFVDDVIPINSSSSKRFGVDFGILDDIELKNKYAFLKVIGDQETLDAYRLADYQSTKSGGGIGITADTPVYLNNKGKRIVIDFDGSYVPDDTTIKTTVSELTEAFNDAEFNKIEDFSELSADEKVKIKRKLTECEGDYGTGNPLYKNLSQLKARDLLELLKNETGLDDLTDVAKNYKGLNSMAKTTKALRGAFGLSIITLSNFESDFFLRKNYFENLEALYIVTKKSIAKL